MKYKLKAFTLIELVIVIVILSILWLIAFTSLDWYSKSARDSTRITDLSSMRTSLEIFNVNSWKYPLPTGYSEITYSWAIVWKQWTYWESVKANTDILDKIPIDPISESKYTYSLTEKWNEFQLAWIMEWNDIVFKNSLPLQKLLNTTYAWDVEALAYVTWNFNEILLKQNTFWTCEVLSVPSIITNDLNVTDLPQIVENNSFVYRWFKNLPSSFRSSKFKSFWWFNFQPNKFVAYSDNNNCEKLTQCSLENITENMSLLKWLQESYIWTLLQNNLKINKIINSETNINNPSDESIESIIDILNNNFWCNIAFKKKNVAVPSCVSKPNYIDAIYVEWQANQLNQQWQSTASNEPCYWTCWSWKVLQWSSCISTSCLWSAPNGTSNISNSTNTVWWIWNYNTIPWLCTYSCNTWYTWNWSDCIINTYSVNWSFWSNWSWWTVNVCWNTVIADSNWNFSTNISHWTTCNNVTMLKNWYECTTITDWPTSIMSNISDVSWSCTIKSYTVSWNFGVGGVTVNVCGTDVTTNTSWWFIANINHWSDCSNVIAIKNWYTCETTTQWPISLTQNISNISGLCTTTMYNISGNFGTNWWTATLNVCWITTTTNNDWTFQVSRSNMSDCSNITATKSWYVCTTTTQWPSSLVSNISNVTWNCVQQTNSCNSTLPTNSIRVVWIPTSVNQSWQSTNPANPCYFRCNSWYGSTWNSCISSTSCNSSLLDITLANWRTWSCMNLWATTVRNGSSTYSCTSSSDCSNKPNWVWDFYQWWRNNTWWTNWNISWNWSWQTPRNDDLWWAVSWNATLKQWPCPNWRIVPSTADWQSACVTLTSPFWCQNDTYSSAKMRTTLKLPYTWFRAYTDWRYWWYTWWYYWANTYSTYWAPTQSYVYAFKFFSWSVWFNLNDYKSDWKIIRCIKK